VSIPLHSVTFVCFTRCQKIFGPKRDEVGCTDVEKEAFTQQLEETATGEYVKIMGDFNAQVGTERNGYENIIGKFGEGTRNQGGRKPFRHV
jgi:hypothetical protein